jgi:hypothetical protein
MTIGKKVRVIRAIYNDCPPGTKGVIVSEYPETHGKGQAALVRVLFEDGNSRPFRLAELAYDLGDSE